MINDYATPPSDAELIQFATDEQFLLFCDEDEFVDIARAVLQRYCAATVAALQSQDREDAERYRWLRDKSRVFKQDPDMSGNHYWMIQSNGLLRGATLDAAIDRAAAGRHLTRD